MSLARLMELSCDACDHRLHTEGETATVTATIRLAKREGWRVGYKEFKPDFCPSCAATPGIVPKDWP